MINIKNYILNFYKTTKMVFSKPSPLTIIQYNQELTQRLSNLLLTKYNLKKPITKDEQKRMRKESNLIAKKLRKKYV